MVYYLILFCLFLPCVQLIRLQSTKEREFYTSEFLENQKHSEFMAFLLRSVGSFKLIMPGTKWCGDGNNANHINDLGTFHKTDACCRDHDLCPEMIHPGQTKYNLTNNGIITRLHCDCDLQLYLCLSDVNSPMSTLVGITYFSALAAPCFNFDYPAKCSQMERIDIRQRCIAYNFDFDELPLYQWFDIPRYYHRKELDNSI